MVGRLRVCTRANLVMGFAVMVIGLVGCGADPATTIAPTETDTVVAFDTQAPDASGSTDVADAGVTSDAAPADTGTSDVGPEDAGVADIGQADAGPADAATSDAGPVDGEINDATADASVPVDTIEQDQSDAVPGPQPCSPALALSPAKGEILPFDLKTFAAKGGTGAYRFVLAPNKSGAVVNKFSGAYLSGNKSGVTDVVKLTDLGCIGSAKAQITVVEPMAMAPLEPWVNYKQALKFKTTQGSGSFTYKIVVNGSGGKINAQTGAYVAGSKDGDDQVRAQDSATGETSTATVHVRKSATLTARPPRLIVPIGSTVEVVVTGGSGHYTLTVPKGAFTSVAGDGKSQNKVKATKAGAASAKVVDVFTGKVINVFLFGVKATEVVTGAAGDGYQAAHVRRVPDLNGDGGDEVVVSLAEGDGDDNNSGVVYVYRSTKGGLDLKPAQIFYGEGKDTRFGYGMRVADVDGDKLADLIVGAPLADVGMSNNGAIYIYKGLKTGIFSAKPIAVLKGAYASDQLGWGVAVCDVNGDGVMDVAGGAIYGEDRTKSPIVSSTGTLMVWLGHQDGFLEKPDISRYGQLPDASGKWKAVGNSRIGWDVAAGDVDGDGVCDLAVTSLYYKGTKSNDGLMVLYRGEKGDATSLGGPTELPVRVWSGVLAGQSGSQFGRSVAMADVDGDGKSEIITGQLNWRGSPALTSRGAAYIFDFKGLTSAPATKIEPVTTAAWMVQGPKSYDYYGYRIAVGDATGDGIADVLVNAGNGEAAKGPSNTGAVLVFAGRKGQMPLKTPTRVVAGLSGGDYFGLGMAAIADVDGDKKPELVAYAGLDDSAGYNLGRPYYVPSKAGAKMQPMQMPAKPSGNRFGWHSRFVGDLNGDGFDDLAISASQDAGNKAAMGAKPINVGTRAGTTYVFKGTASGVDVSQPAWRAGGFYGHSSHDYLGWRVARGGDFDGDGIRDFAVLARYEDRPSSFNSNYTKGSTCSGGSRNNSAAAYVFRGQKGTWPASKPAWVAYGPQTSQTADSVAMGIDINGDGKGDLVMSGLGWDAPGQSNAGGWGVYWGRSAPAAGIRVVCAPDKLVLGIKSNDYLGRDVVGLHDIDGDGCDEFAVGADGEDHGQSAQGTVHIVFGWGSKCASMTPREVVLTGGASNARAGYSLDSGADVDGDKIPDLLVGGYNYSNGSAAVGTAWVVTSGYLKSLKPQPIVTGQPPSKLYPMVPPGTKTRVSVTGAVTAGQFGWSVAFVPGLEKDGRAGVLVGSPSGGQQSGALTGGAELFRWMKTGTTPGLTLHPMLAIAGESSRPGGKLGSSVAAGSPKKGKPVLVLGGYWATPTTSKQLDQGAAYVVPIAQP